MACYLLVSYCLADEVAITDIHISPLLADFDFRELNHGSTLNREQGTLYGVGVGASTTWQQLILRGRVNYLVNDVSHHGQTQSGTPVRTRTDEQIWDTLVQLGWRIQPATVVEYRLYAGLGYRDWDRDISSTRSATGLFENYRWAYGALGAELVFRQSEKSHWLVATRLLHPIDPTMKIKFKTDLDNAELDLGEELGHRLSLTWRYRMLKKWQFGIKAFYTTWDLGKSDPEQLNRNGAVIGSVFEPASKTHNSGLQFTVSYSIQD